MPAWVAVTGLTLLVLLIAAAALWGGRGSDGE